jgi:hypothetical protein
LVEEEDHDLEILISGVTEVCHAGCAHSSDSVCKHLCGFPTDHPVDPVVEEKEGNAGSG